jgi:tight adherence protein C
MIQLLGAVLVGLAAVALVEALRPRLAPNAGDSPAVDADMAQLEAGIMESASAKAAQRRLSARRFASLEEAAGAVAVDEGALAGLARAQVLFTVLLGALGVLFVLASPEPIAIIIAVVLVAFGWKLPLILARSRETRRVEILERELVDTLPELIMGVEAGLTLDVAMARYADRQSGPLAREFRYYLDRVQLGVQRSVAMQDLVRRSPSPIMRLYVTAVVQNQRLGTPLAATLRMQATTARRQRRQTVEEKAAKIPLKMIFPTVFCILPVLMIVMVGPSMIRLLEVL